MPRESRELKNAIKEEVAHWPGVSVEFVSATGGGHPKAKLPFEGRTLARAYSGNSDTQQALHCTVRDMRQIMVQLGATRADEPKKAPAQKRHRKDTGGREARPDPVVHEAVVPKPAIGDLLAEHPAAALLPAVPINQDKTEHDEAEPLGPGEWDIDEDRYHADPCPEPSLTCSIAKKMIDLSCYHGWHAHPRLNPKWEPAKDLLQHRIGRAFHAMLLGKGAPIDVFDHKDWKKDVAKADRDASLAAGRTPLLEEQAAKIEAMVRAARRQIGAREELAFAMAGGIPERVYIWVEETKAGPIYCRMMVDWTPHAGRYPVDWKTAGQSAGPEAWGQRAMWDQGCEIQDAFYRRGFKAVTGVEYDALMFAVIESDEPHALMHHRVMPATQEAADMDVRWAINAFGICLKRGRWPGYPTAMAWQERPGWRASRVESKWDSGQRNLEELEAQLAQLATMKDITPRLAGPDVTEDNPFGLEG